MADGKLPLWWLSYADEEVDESRGVAIVRAGSFLGAAKRARALGISPKPVQALFQQADGLWGFETVHAEHDCPEEKEEEDAG